MEVDKDFIDNTKNANPKRKMIDILFKNWELLFIIRNNLES